MINVLQSVCCLTFNLLTLTSRLLVMGPDIPFFLALIGLPWSLCGVGNESLGSSLSIRPALPDPKSVSPSTLSSMTRSCDPFRTPEESILRYMYGLGVRGSNYRYLFYALRLYGRNGKNMFSCVCSSLNLQINYMVITL